MGEGGIGGIGEGGEGWGGEEEGNIKSYYAG